MNINTIFHWIAWWLRVFFILIYPISTKSTQRVLRVSRGCTLLHGTWSYLYFLGSCLPCPCWVFLSLDLWCSKSLRHLWHIKCTFIYMHQNRLMQNLLIWKFTYVQYIYCQLFVFKIADIRLDVLHINSKTNEINKNIYHKIPMNAYC